LTHTVQQAGSAGTTIQKDPKDNKKEGIGRTPPDADFVKMEGTGPEQDHILFPLDSIDVKPAAVKKLKALLTGHTGPVVLVVRGYASVEGDDEYNVNISAHRAIAVSRVLQDLLPAGSDVHAYAYGKTTDFGDARDNRRVGIEVLDKPERTSTFHPHIDLGIRKDFGTLGTPSLVAPPTFSLGVPGLPKPPLPPPIAPNYFIEIPSIIPPPTYSGAAEAFSARNLRLSDENQDALYQNYLRNYHFFSYFFPNDHKFAGQLADKALGIYYDRELAREHANRMDELYELDKRLGGPGKPFTVPIITPDSLEWVGKKLGIVKDKKKE
jgi:outer membrane protein OmpA-like peptidoglycan-associated protein